MASSTNGTQRRRRALITGASGGLGLEFAKLFASEGYDLVIVARSKDRLEEIANDLKERHGTSTVVITKDLTVSSSSREIFDELSSTETHVDVLVNNAGFATYGLFTELDLDRETQMIRINVETLTALTGLFVKPMVKQGFGKILNVASTAAFQPGPLMAVYYATKGYVLSFSEAIANELKGTGVTVTALCPPPTATGFQTRANMQESKLVAGGLMSAEEVVRIGYNALMRGKTVVVPGFNNKLLSLAPRFAPRNVTTKLVRRVQERNPS